MEKNELQINNNISLEKSNTRTVNFEEQKFFLNKFRTSNKCRSGFRNKGTSTQFFRGKCN